jgi:hypothetical protein
MSSKPRTGRSKNQNKPQPPTVSNRNTDRNSSLKKESSKLEKTVANSRSSKSVSKTSKVPEKSQNRSTGLPSNPKNKVSASTSLNRKNKPSKVLPNSDLAKLQNYAKKAAVPAKTRSFTTIKPQEFLKSIAAEDEKVKKQKQKPAGKSKSNVMFSERKNEGPPERRSSTKTTRKTPSLVLHPNQAAAKLSITWPPYGKESKEKPSATDEPKVLNPSLAQEMKRFLTNNKQLVKKANWPFKDEKDWNDAIHDILQSMQLTSQQERAKASGQTKYKAVGAPKWNEVQTNWPGFEHKPLPNWKDYATPKKPTKTKPKTKK